MFEGLAGGGVIIATPISIIVKYFRDVVYIADISLVKVVLDQYVLKVLRNIRSNPMNDYIVASSKIGASAATLEFTATSFAAESVVLLSQPKTLLIDVPPEEQTGETMLVVLKGIDAEAVYNDNYVFIDNRLLGGRRENPDADEPDDRLTIHSGALVNAALAAAEARATRRTRRRQSC